MKTRMRIAKLKWEGSDDSGGLMVVCRSRIACVARYFRNAKGSVTALDRTYTTVRGAKRAIEHEFVWKRR
jgi:hypothetical protein